MSLDIKICLASKGIAMTSSVGDTVNVEQNIQIHNHSGNVSEEQRDI